MGSKSEINKDNIIDISVDELTEEDRQAYEAMCKADKEERRQAEEERRRAFVSCFTKTKQGLTKKGGAVLPGAATIQANTSVSEPLLSQNDIANMIDQSVSSKIVNSVESMMKNMFDSTLRPALMRIQDEQLLKRPVDDNFDNSDAKTTPMVNIVPSAPNVYLSNPQDGQIYMGSAITTSSIVAPIRTLNNTTLNVSTSVPHSRISETSANLQTPYYQTVAYSVPPIPPQGTRIPHGPVPNAYFNMSQPSAPLPPIQPELVQPMANPVLSLQDQVRAILRDQLGLDPRGAARTYKKPYTENYDTVPYPHGFRVPDFVKFTREDIRLHMSI